MPVHTFSQDHVDHELYSPCPAIYSFDFHTNTHAYSMETDGSSCLKQETIFTNHLCLLWCSNGVFLGRFPDSVPDGFAYISAWELSQCGAAIAFYISQNANHNDIYYCYYYFYFLSLIGCFNGPCCPSCGMICFICYLSTPALLLPWPQIFPIFHRLSLCYVSEINEWGKGGKRSALNM